MKSKIKKSFDIRYINALYWLGMILIFWYIDYLKILGMIPQGIHFMRQTDSLSIIIHYVKNGMQFWEPGILNLDSEGGRTASEFPIFYYLIAGLYKLTGDHEIYLRLFNVIILYTGFYKIFRLFLKQLNQPFIALVANYILSATMLVYYYGNNFLPDAAGLGFSLWGIAVFFPVFEGNKSNWRIVCGLMMMTMAALLKISYFIYPTALLTALLIDQLWLQKKPYKEVLNQNLWLILVFSSGLVLLLSWVLFIRHYNEVNHGYFLVKAKTFLDADSEDREKVFKHVTGYWATTYYPSLTKYFLSLLFLFGVYHFRKSNPRLFLLSTISILGSVAFFFLFFLQFADHDYYFLAFIPTIVIGSLFSLKQTEHFLLKRKHQHIFLIALFIVAINGVYYSDYKMWKRYRESYNDLYSQTGQQLQGADKILDDAGFSRDIKLMIVTDRNINGGLYFTRRNGWPIMDTSWRFARYIAPYVRKGATHMLLLDSNFIHVPMIKAHIKEKVFSSAHFTLYTVK